MKLIACFSAALVAGAMILPITASAAPQTTHTVTTTRDGGTTTRVTTTRHRDNGWHGGTRWRTSCRTYWRHGHKYRTCRKVRYHV